MSILRCTHCESIFPLSAPRALGDNWYARCADCMRETEVEPVPSAESGKPAFRIKARKPGAGH
jgi:hypothetical protein